MVLEVFKQHNEDFALLVGKEYAPGTMERYKTSLTHTRKFIEWKYKVKDIDVTKLNYGFISSYALARIRQEPGERNQQSLMA